MHLRLHLRLAAVLAWAWPLSVLAAPATPGTPAPAPASDRFAKIEAFLNTHCIECHGVKSKKADLALNVYHDVPALLQDRKVFERAIEMVREGEMPPSKRPQPSDAETANFVHGIEAIFDDADRTAKPDPGRVTIRRLNRTEYNNTIRDLMGVDFQPAEDFPSDDIGHGFDNIGDVLAISPVLMERYLAAAENIVNRAILLDLPKPQKRRSIGRDLEPQRFFSDAQLKAAPRYRALAPGSPLSMPLRLSIPGEYTIRLRAFAPPVGDQPAKIALLLDDKEFKQFDVSGGDDKQGLAFETSLSIDPGTHRLSFALLNPDVKPSKTASVSQPTTAPTKRTASIVNVEVEDPADTRPVSHRALLAYSPTSTTKAQQTREILTRFATRAYRRPPTPDEVDRLIALADGTEAAGEKWEAGIQMAMQAVLSSPKFLFRVELDDRPDSLEPHPIGEYPLASRLSYFLWASTPDDELLALAGKGQLTANLEPQVRRMLKDPRAASLVDGFAMQWLQLRRLRSVAPDTKTYPSFDERLRTSMQLETQLFVNAVIKEDRSVLDLINADFTFLNRTLARFYGINDPALDALDAGRNGRRNFGAPVSEKDFVRVALPKNGDRGGILTQASVLTVTSNPTRTSPVKRGRWVLEQILGAPPPPPPPDVPELKTDANAQLSGSLRQRMEQHRANPACASCHAKMDPIGFAFENFDGVGAFRKKDGDFVIDPSGTLPDGKSFKGPAELRSILIEKKGQFTKCLAEKMMTYALGRGVQFYDRRAVNKICDALEKDDYRFSRLVIEIAKSDPFRLRRGAEQQEKPDKNAKLE